MDTRVHQNAAAERIERRAARWGLTLGARGRGEDYDRVVPAEHRLTGRSPGRDALLLLGNDRRLWAPFLRWLDEDRARLELEHPLDSYVEAAVAFATEGIDVTALWLHDRARPRLSAARLAERCGLASRGPAGLVAHPGLGPWIALRVALLLPGPGWPVAPASSPCAGCAAPCATALAEVLAGAAGASEGAAPDHAAVASRWRDWVAVRDACPVGAEGRYGDAQLEYHYTKERAVLRRELLGSGR